MFNLMVLDYIMPLTMVDEFEPPACRSERVTIVFLCCTNIHVNVDKLGLEID